MIGGSANLDPMKALPDNPEARLRFAAKQLESLWISHMLKEARSQSSGGLDNSFAGRMFHDMLDEALADHMAESGAFGLGEKIIQQMHPADSSAGNLHSMKQNKLRRRT